MIPPVTRPEADVQPPLGLAGVAPGHLTAGGAGSCWPVKKEGWKECLQMPSPVLPADTCLTSSWEALSLHR